MITRIVKLEFQESFLEELQENLPAIKQKVLSSEGCNNLRILLTKDSATIFTVSKWDSEKHLNQYRDSEKFKKIWAFFKPNFSAKPMAWTNIEL